MIKFSNLIGSSNPENDLQRLEGMFSCRCMFSTLFIAINLQIFINYQCASPAATERSELSKAD